MALNEIQMKRFSEGSPGTGDRVDELTLPVDILHRSRSQQAYANEKDLDLEMNLQNENFGAGPSGGSSEDVELVHPISESRSEAEFKEKGRVTFVEPIREEYQDDGGRTHQPVGESENTDHIITVEESDHICRTCGPDEDITEPDNLLVKLGCNCRGSLSRMHRKCILEWYGPRICQENNYKCELCNALLHGRIERVVFRALIGRDSGGDILMKAVGPYPRARRSSLRPNTNAEAPTVQAHGNADPDFQINIVEIIHPAQRPHLPIMHSAHNRPEPRPYLPSYGSTRGGYPMCVMVFVILVLIGFGVALGKH